MWVEWILFLILDWLERTCTCWKKLTEIPSVFVFKHVLLTLNVKTDKTLDIS